MEKRLMTENVYGPFGHILIAGSCLKTVEPEAFAHLSEKKDGVYDLCLEETHINMAITKIGGMLRTGKVHNIVFATVDSGVVAARTLIPNNFFKKFLLFSIIFFFQ